MFLDGLGIINNAHTSGLGLLYSPLLLWPKIYILGEELGDGLDPLGDGVLGQLAGQQEPDGGLDVLKGEGRGLRSFRGLASLEASPASRSKRSLTKESRIPMDLKETPICGWTCSAP